MVRLPKKFGMSDFYYVFILIRKVGTHGSLPLVDDKSRLGPDTIPVTSGDSGVRHRVWTVRHLLTGVAVFVAK
jgi:hypothetical protein